MTNSAMKVSIVFKEVTYGEKRSAFIGGLGERNDI